MNSIGEGAVPCVWMFMMFSIACRFAGLSAPLLLKLYRLVLIPAIQWHFAALLVF
jgi:hypothetical protein